MRLFIKEDTFIKLWIVFIISMIIMSFSGAMLTGCVQDEERIIIDLDDRISDAESRELVAEREPGIILFGFDLRSRPQEDARQYIPFLEYLTRVTGYRFELHFSGKDGKIVDDLGADRVQFAAVGCGSYLMARHEYGVIPIAHGLNLQGRPEYQSLIVVSSDSPIRKIEDLRGKRFAFGSVTSTQGHLIPRIILAEHGLALEDLGYYEFTGSHRNCANEVISGRFHAGGIQDTMGRELIESGLLRIVQASKFYPSSCIAANKDVPPEVLARVKQALINFQPRGRDAASLYHWDKTEMANGFSEANDDNYAELRKWAHTFGLLTTQAER